MLSFFERLVYAFVWVVYYVHVDICLLFSIRCGRVGLVDACVCVMLGHVV